MMVLRRSKEGRVPDSDVVDFLFVFYLLCIISARDTHKQAFLTFLITHMN